MYVWAPCVHSITCLTCRTYHEIYLRKQLYCDCNASETSPAGCCCSAASAQTRNIHPDLPSASAHVRVAMFHDPQCRTAAAANDAKVIRTAVE
eukprot:5185088-Amphidinium_carterae.3